MTGETKDLFAICSEIAGKLRGLSEEETNLVLRWIEEARKVEKAAPVTTATVPVRQAKPRQVAAPALAPAPEVAEGEAVDLRSFIRRKRPKNDAQFVVLVTYYYQHLVPEGERLEVVTPEDVGRAAESIKWRLRKRPGIPMNNAARLGYLVRKDRGQFALTEKGLALVEKLPPKRTRPARARKTSD